MQFDQATIHNLAAEMFWRMANECGVGEVNERVLATEGRCLLEHRFDNDLWREYPLASLPDHEATRILDAAAFEAFDFTRDQQNMIGQVYLEDRERGRSPSAASIDTQPLARVPTFSSNRAIERVGRLCLRHPLPAVVFAKSAPTAAVVQVNDTATALGFDLPMFLNVVGRQQFGDDTVILTGYFLIPVPDMATGDRWDHVIQNSHRSVQGNTLHTSDGEWVIRYEWSAPKRAFSWLRRS